MRAKTDFPKRRSVEPDKGGTMGAFNKMGGHLGRSPGRPKKPKTNPEYENQEYTEDWNWLFGLHGKGASDDYKQRELMNNVHGGEKKSSQYRINYCKQCHKCWEKVRKTINLTGCLYYEDFPTLGKRRVICPQCAKKGS